MHLLALLATSFSIWAPVHGSEAIAAKTWGAPSCGQPQVSFHRLSHKLAEAEPDACAIFVDTSVLRWHKDRFTRVWGDRWLCTMVVHEWGHLIGYTDWRNTNDPSHAPDWDTPNPMRANPQVYAPCMRWARPGRISPRSATIH